MKATAQLQAEHEGIRLMLQIVEAICVKLEAGERVNPEHLEKIIEFFRVFVDRCHHGKEEELLFPVMEAAGVPKQGGPLGVMLAEHDIGRGHVRGMAAALERYPTENEQAGLQLAAHAREYMTLLNEHIDWHYSQLIEKSRLLKEMVSSFE